MTPAPGTWSGVGHHAGLLWGAVQGSAPQPYQVLVLLPRSAARCSCPSRRVPCKHATALQRLWALGQVPDAAAPPRAAAEWVASRDRPAGPRAGSGPRPTDPEAAAARLAQRRERVRLGLEELDLWLADQVRGGLAALQRAGYGPVDQMAARLVDAQAPGVAGLLRALPGRLVGEGWPGRALEHLAMIRLLVAAHRRLDQLPPELAATVRTRVGYPVSKDSVLATPPVRDRWAVLGHVDVVDHLLATRRVWLRGATSGRWALLLSFAAGGADLDATVMPGVTIEADLHFYPGAGQYRALVGTEHARTDLRSGDPDVPSLRVDEAATGFGRLLGEDPWAERMPVVLRGAPLLPTAAGEPWGWRDEHGATVPLPAGAEAWPLLARSMGDPVEVAGEWTRQGFLPLAALPHPLEPAFSVEVLAR